VLINECGADVRILVRNFKNASRVARFNVTFCVGDVGDLESLDKAVHGCDIIFNLAYDFGVGNQHKRAVSAAAAENIAHVAHVNNIRRVVHFGTFSSYGDTKDGLLDESMELSSTEDAYGLSKRDADDVLLRWAKEKALPVSIIEPTIVYGPFSKPWTHGPLAQLSTGIVVLPKNGLGLCNAVYVDDVIQAALLCAIKPEAVGQKFLISDEKPVSWSDFFGAYESMLGFNATICLDDAAIDHLSENPRLALATVSDIPVSVVQTEPQQVSTALKQREIAPIRSAEDLKGNESKLYIPSTARRIVLASKTIVDIGKAKRMLGYKPGWNFDAGMRMTGKYAAWANLIESPLAPTGRSGASLQVILKGGASAIGAQRLRTDRERLTALRNKHAGRRCFIIGNGPSLNQTDLRLLKDEVTIACNGIFLLYEEMGFKPTYFTVEDSLVAEDRAATVNGMEGTTKIFPADLRYCLLPNKDTAYINFVRPGYKGFPKFSDDLEKQVFWGGTVTYLNLQLAYFLGCSEIYLVGVDHNYRDKNQEDEQQHLTIMARTPDPNHFHPDYFGAGFRYHVPNTERMEVGYRKAKEFLNAKGVEVLNATKGGRLEVFPRVEYETLFSDGLPRGITPWKGASPVSSSQIEGDEGAQKIPVSLADFKDRYKGKRCFIIGNGPSLNSVDFSRIKDEFTFGVNGIFYKTAENGFAPTFYVVEDNHVISDNIEAINAYQCAYKFFPDRYRSEIRPEKQTFFFNLDMEYYRPGEMFGIPRFSEDCSKVVFAGNTVTYLNMQLAHYFGFSEVYLIGMDFSYTVPPSTIVIGTDYFANEADPNHFHPDYFGRGKKWHNPRLDKVSIAYKLARRVFENSGRKILNATEGGRLEIFDRTANSSTEQPIRNSRSSNWWKAMKPDALAETSSLLISVIIPAFNVEKYIEKCLLSVASQTFDKSTYEIVVVDDASTDGTLERILAVAKSHQNIKVVTNVSNSGLSNARNRGMDNSTGRFVLFLDGDDYIDPRTLEKLYKVAKEKKCDVVISGFNRVKESGEIVSTRDLKEPLTKEKLLRKLFSAEFSNVAWGALIDRAIFEDHDIRYVSCVHHEDVYTTYQVYFYAKNIEFLDEPLFSWLFRESSISNSINFEILVDYIHGFVSRKEFLEREKLFKTYRDEFHKGLAMAVSHLHSRSLKLDDKESQQECYIALFNASQHYFGGEFEMFLPARVAEFFKAMRENRSRYLSEQLKVKNETLSASSAGISLARVKSDLSKYLDSLKPEETKLTHANSILREGGYLKAAAIYRALYKRQPIDIYLNNMAFCLNKKFNVTTFNADFLRSNILN
jgi:glycosyltransferase involved in cell wall biosynthesis/nucleoside-diphosphate-sugar epimerase/uncharacterized Rossmann fold enzyme